MSVVKKYSKALKQQFLCIVQRNGVVKIFEGTIQQYFYTCIVIYDCLVATSNFNMTATVTRQLKIIATIKQTKNTHFNIFTFVQIC